MTNVEALLSVESGKIPDGVEVFLERDVDAERARGWYLLAAVLGGAALVGAVRGGDVPASALLALFALMAFVVALPVRQDEPQRPRLILLCDRGLIIREAWGLRNWRYEEIVRLSRFSSGGETLLCLEDREGVEHLIDQESFRDSERLIEELFRRIESHRL